MSRPKFKSLGKCCPSRFRSRESIDATIRSQAPSECRSEYWRLIHAIRSRSDLFAPSRGRCGESGFQRLAMACARLARNANRWFRQPESWNPPRVSSAHLLWGDFIHHLLHQYETPAFFAPAWCHEFHESWQRELHFHVGQGRSVRRFAIPGFGRISKSVARWFMQAPVDAGVDEAVRWAQVRAAGGDEKLARLLMSRIAVCSSEPHEGWETCWKSTIDFLVRHQPISIEEALGIVVFVYEQRFEPARRTVGPWMGAEPVNTTLDLRSWTLRRLRGHMAHWREAYPAPRGSDIGWPPSQFRPMEKTQDGNVWQVTELCTARQLRLEGRMMNHCVATYVRYCRKGDCSIWSMRRLLPGNRIKSVITVDVDPRRRRILDAKGKANSQPSPIALQLLGEWAQREGDFDGEARLK